MTRTLLFASALALFASACSSEEPLGARTIDVPMSYEDSTNWGPTDATGMATINTATGQIDIHVAGLPMLDGDLYEGWLAGGGESPTSTGVFNADAEGVGDSSIVLGSLVDRTFARVVLTVEPDPDPSSSPDQRHSIGGDIP